MQTVTFLSAFTVEVDSATSITYPQGWSGPVDDEIADLAAEAGCIEAKAKPSRKGKAAVADAEAPPA